MNLELGLNEYYATSRDLYETAHMYQVARNQGIAEAREADAKRKENERRQKESLAKLRAEHG